MSWPAASMAGRMAVRACRVRWDSASEASKVIERAKAGASLLAIEIFPQLMVPMRLRTITLQHFRNIRWRRWHSTGGSSFCSGPTARVKPTCWRRRDSSRRCVLSRHNDGKLLVAHAQAEAAIACTVEHERCGNTNLTIELRPDGRELWCDGEKVTRIADYLGRFDSGFYGAGHDADPWRTGRPAALA